MSVYEFALVNLQEPIKVRDSNDDDDSGSPIFDTATTKLVTLLELLFIYAGQRIVAAEVLPVMNPGPERTPFKMQLVRPFVRVCGWM